MAKRPEEELILFLYGEHPTPEELERELAIDPELGRRYESLRRELVALDGLDAAEPRPGLEARMWARVAPALVRPSRAPWLAGWFRWAALTSALVAVVLVAFLAGRGLRPVPTEQQAADALEALPPDARDRVLAAALADHLESSERLLLEVSNGAPALDQERRWAATLLGANRLYRQAAERAGQRRVAAVLVELELLLAQLANAPESFDPRQSPARADSRDLLFKVRITRNNMKELS